MKRSLAERTFYKIFSVAAIATALFLTYQLRNREKQEVVVAPESPKNAQIAPAAEASAGPTKITVVAATNRKGSLTAQVADHYAALLRQKGCEVQLLSLTDLPHNFTSDALYENFGKSAAFNKLKAIMETSQKYVFIVPEYNGSFPGVFKAFIDGLVFPGTFIDKNCALVGVSMGPQGGVFAMSHLTDIFHMAHMSVYPLKPRLAGILDAQLSTVLANETYTRQLEKQAEGFIKY